MAFRRRFRGYQRGFRRSYRRGFRGSGGNGLMFTAGGAIAGYMAPRVVPYQDLAITAIAVAPFKMPRAVRRLASGYVLGMLVKGFIAPTSSGSLSNQDFA